MAFLYLSQPDGSRAYPYEEGGACVLSNANSYTMHLDNQGVAIPAGGVSLFIQTATPVEQGIFQQYAYVSQDGLTYLPPSNSLYNGAYDLTADAWALPAPIAKTVPNTLNANRLVDYAVNSSGDDFAKPLTFSLNSAPFDIDPVLAAYGLANQPVPTYVFIQALVNGQGVAGGSFITFPQSTAAVWTGIGGYCPGSYTQMTQFVCQQAYARANTLPPQYVAALDTFFTAAEPLGLNCKPRSRGLVPGN